MNTQFAAVELPKCLEGPTTPTTDPPTAADCNTETEARAGMGTATLMTQFKQPM